MVVPFDLQYSQYYSEELHLPHSIETPSLEESYLDLSVGSEEDVPARSTKLESQHPSE